MPLNFKKKTWNNTYSNRYFLTLSGTIDLEPLRFKTDTASAFSWTSKTKCLRIASISTMMSYADSLKLSWIVKSFNHFCNISSKGSSKQVIIVSRIFCLFPLTIIMESYVSFVSSQTVSDLIIILWRALVWCAIYNSKTICIIMVGFLCSLFWLQSNFKFIICISFWGCCLSW